MRRRREQPQSTDELRFSVFGLATTFGGVTRYEIERDERLDDDALAHALGMIAYRLREGGDGIEHPYD